MRLVTVIRSHKLLLTKIFRFLAYLLLLFGLSYQIQRLYKKLKIDPEIFSKENLIQSDEIPFPAVTICPPNAIKNEAWNADFLKQYNLTLNDLRGASLQTCPNYDMLMEYRNSDVNIVDVLINTSPNFADNAYHCGVNNYWENLQNCEKIFVKSVTEYGICYTFNMLGHNMVFNQIISSDFDTFKRTKIAKTWDPDLIMNDTRHKDDTNAPTWNLETGYLSDEDYVQPARAMKMQELTFGTTNKINDSFCEVRGNNYKLILHLPNELPQISYDTVNIPIGFEVKVLISAKMTQNEESLRNFPPETRGCFFEGEKKLKFFKSYTKINCKYECMTEFVYSTCGCVKFSMPRTEDMKVCDYNFHTCVLIVTTAFPRSYYEIRENKEKFKHFPCGCLPSCTEIKYNVIKYEVEDKQSIFMTKTHKHAVLSIIFADSQIEKTSNYVTYEMENFVFDIGGLIGLFLGSSILSVLNTIFTICVIIKNKCQRNFKWFQQRISHESSAISSRSSEFRQPERFETVLDIPCDEIESINSVVVQESEILNDYNSVYSISLEHA